MLMLIMMMMMMMMILTVVIMMTKNDDDNDYENDGMSAMMRTLMILVKVKVEEIPVEYAWVGKQPESR